MAKVKAKALQSLAGEYGMAVAGDEIVLNKKHAEELQERGAIEIVGEADEAEVKEKETSFNITDNTGKPKEKAEQETDPADPTGKEKNDKAGPGAAKTTAAKTATKAAAKGGKK